MPRCVAALIEARGNNTKYWRPYGKISICCLTIILWFRVVPGVQKNCTPLRQVFMISWLSYSDIDFLIHIIYLWASVAIVHSRFCNIIVVFSFLSATRLRHVVAVQYFWTPLYICDVSAATSLVKRSTARSTCASLVLGSRWTKAWKSNSCLKRYSSLGHDDMFAEITLECGGNLQKSNRAIS